MPSRKIYKEINAVSKVVFGENIIRLPDEYFCRIRVRSGRLYPFVITEPLPKVAEFDKTFSEYHDQRRNHEQAMQTGYPIGYDTYWQGLWEMPPSKPQRLPNHTTYLENINRSYACLAHMLIARSTVELLKRGAPEGYTTKFRVEPEIRVVDGILKTEKGLVSYHNGWSDHHKINQIGINCNRDR